MRIPHSLLPAIRSLTVVGFAALCATIFGYLWINAGGKIPLVSRSGYQVHVSLPDVDNLVFQSDVRMAGVDIGKVENVQVTGRQANVTVQLNQNAPLHQGATMTVRNKTMIEETYLDVVDGKGTQIPDGATLPQSAGKPSVELNDVLTSLDDPTRQALASTLRSSGMATQGSAQDVSAALDGLGELGRSGGDATSALAAQSQSLSQLNANTTAVLRALDTGQGRIAELVQDSDTLANTVATNKTDVEAAMRELPPVLDTTRSASGRLTQLSGSLAPVAANLSAASPSLSAALQQLPATSEDLRGLLPSLNRTLDAAPGTLNRVPPFSQAVRPLFPTLQGDVADLNPMLAYLRPYGRDAAAFFANFSQFLSGSDPNGNIGRVLPVYNEKSPNSPMNTQIGPLDRNNPYPPPGGSANPGQSSAPPPRVDREGPGQ